MSLLTLNPCIVFSVQISPFTGSEKDAQEGPWIIVPRRREPAMVLVHCAGIPGLSVCLTPMPPCFLPKYIIAVKKERKRKEIITVIIVILIIVILIKNNSSEVTKLAD